MILITIEYIVQAFHSNVSTFIVIFSILILQSTDNLHFTRSLVYLSVLFALHRIEVSCHPCLGGGVKRVEGGTEELCKGRVNVSHYNG